MKRTFKRKFYLSKPLLDLNTSSSGCAPCLKEASKINSQVNRRPLNEIKIEEIKKIVRSIFKK